MEHLRLSELSEAIQGAFKAHLQASYWVVAEISELRVAQNGHCYMEFVEKDDSNRFVAKYRANMWASTYRNLGTWFERMAGEPLRAGMKVLANVEVQFHPVYSLSLTVKDLDPNYTVGERARQRQQTINQLMADGIFDMNKETELALVPQSIAIISSATAAGYGDFMDQISNNTRNYHFHTQLFPASMQGDTAAHSIIEAMHRVYEAGEDFDLLIIIRGGGAQTDLDCFDSYELSSHIAQFPLPVLTGIGHDRDETIADLVAHTALKTPTAVAEYLISLLENFEGEVLHLFGRIAQAGRGRLAAASLQIERRASQLRQAYTEKLRQQETSLLRISNKLEGKSRERFREKRFILDQWMERIKTRATTSLRKESEKLRLLERSLQLSDPAEILRRGYTITYLNGDQVRPGQDFPAGATLETKGIDFSITSTITTSTHGKEKI